MLPSTLPAASTLLDLGDAAQGGPPAGPPFVALRPLRGGFPPSNSEQLRRPWNASQGKRSQLGLLINCRV
jgi:hypothetical protein